MADVEVIFFPLYLNDYARDTSHLTAEQDGCYFRLLRRLYSHGNSIPNNPNMLAAICGVTPLRWKREIAPVLMPLFRIDEAGNLSQARVARELQEIAKRSSQSANAANARWKQNKNSKNKPAKPLKNNKQDDAGAYAGAYAGGYADAYAGGYADADADAYAATRDTFQKESQPNGFDSAQGSASPAKASESDPLSASPSVEDDAASATPTPQRRREKFVETEIDPLTGEEVPVTAPPAPAVEGAPDEPAVSPFGVPIPARISQKMIEAAFQAYRLAAPTWAICRQIPKTQPPRRIANMAAFLKTYAPEGWDMLLRKVGESDYLQNRTPRKTSPITIDFLLKPEFASRILEGNYDDKFTNDTAPSQPATREDGIARQLREAKANVLARLNGHQDGDDGVGTD